jgi:hypothetical protein
MKAKHLRPTPRASRVTRALVVPVAVATALGVTAPAFAGKPARGASTSASCSATPNPVAQYADYTLSVRGLPAGEIVNVQVTDGSGATTVWQVQADDTGATGVVGHAWWCGTSNVAVKKQAKHSWTVLTSCSFSVV